MTLAPCGVDCGSCELDESCSDCHSVKGNPFYLKDFGLDVCPLYDCPVNKKGYQTCAECPELPCQIFYDWKDPDSTDEEHAESIVERVNTLKASL